MKVIAGDLKGRRLVTPAGDMVRPTGARAKEALFSIIGDTIVGAAFVDVFCGTGNVGIEAISRGARRAVFIERNPRVAEILRRNIEGLGIGDRSRVMTLDALKAIRALGKRGEAVDIVFLDPPYAYRRVSEIMYAVAEGGLVAAGGTVIWQHAAKTTPAAAYADLELDTTRIYGDTGVSFYKKKQ